MMTSFGALCTDFYVNQKLSVKLDLPSNRETVLDMFDRVRREFPRLDHFRRYDDELALESPTDEAAYNWLALRRTSIRSGWVNPTTLTDAYRLHRLILETAPYYLSVSPLDVEFLELVFGFDIEVDANRNEVVFDALMRGSPLAQLVDEGREELIDNQPCIGFSLNADCDLQAFVEIKTRTTPGDIAQRRFSKDPISIFLTVRRYGPMRSMEDISTAFGLVAGHVEQLAEERIIPHVVLPIREATLSHPG